MTKPSTDLVSIFEGAIDRLDDGTAYRNNTWTFSCNAINDYTMRYCTLEEQRAVARIVEKVAPMTVGATTGRCFDEFPWGPERQLARALWLTFLAELAEQGDLTWEGLK